MLTDISERISDDIQPPKMKLFEYGYPHSNAHLKFYLQKESKNVGQYVAA